MQTGFCGMDFRRLSQITRKIVKGSKRISSTSEEMSIFVKLPSSDKSTITLMVEPLEKIAAVKEQIEEKTQYLVSRQSLFYSGKRLDDRETLASYSISKDSTLHLKLWAEVTPYAIEIQILPINHFVTLRIPQGLGATIREVKDFIFFQQGIDCEDLYLDDDITGEQLGDNVTLEACRIPERTLVLVQSETDFSSHGSSRLLYSPFTAKHRISRGLIDAAFKEAYNSKRTLPSLEDMEVYKASPEKKSKKHRQASEVETAIATMLQTHQDCERKLSHMLDEKNQLQADLRGLQMKYPKLLSDVLQEKDKLERELGELREYPRKLSRAVDEKKNLQQHLNELQSELSLVLDENSKLESDSIRLQKEVDTLTIEIGHERERGLCNICFDKPRDTLVFSCLHLHFCSSCLEKHQERMNNTCPTCRGFISGKLVCNVSIS